MAALAFAIALLGGCASQPTRAPAAAVPHGANPQTLRAAVMETARRQLDVRYRYGGASPEIGFDCSGLVVYSYGQAGVRGLPRSASALERRAEPVDLEALQPGDLLFFRLSGKKTSHVAIYDGDGHFIHAPSSGGKVERVDFDHVYWGPRIRRAGRLLP